MQTHDDTTPAFFKLGLAWFGYAFGSITLQDVVLFLTAIYTLIQLYILVRDKIVRNKP